MFEKIDLGIFIHDNSHRVIAINAAAERLTGYSREKIVGEDCRTVLDGDLCDKSCNLCRDTSTKSRQFCQETQKLNNDGTLSWIRLNAFTIDGENGQTYYVVVIKEVTEIKILQEHVGHMMSCCNIIGKSDVIKNVFHMVSNVADTDIPVLIIGETGVGKELIASAICKHSPRKDKPFIKTNCAGLPETLVESELFGHVRGAFTGAISDRVGRFEAAGGGTIFLDEVGELSLPIQSKLLRVLQEKEIERLGEHRTRKVNFRIIAATNRDLAEEVKCGRFREDLYYRLAGVILKVPPLRERQEDIPLLIHHFLSELNNKYAKDVEGISSELMKKLMIYPWPGNIRELYNLLESTYVMRTGKVLTSESVPHGHLGINSNGDLEPSASPGETPAKQPSNMSEKDRIMQSLQDNRYNISATAKLLGIGRTTLWRKMKIYDIKSGSATT